MATHTHPSLPSCSMQQKEWPVQKAWAAPPLPTPKFLFLSSHHPTHHSTQFLIVKWSQCHVTTVPSRGEFSKLPWCPLGGCDRLHFPKMAISASPTPTALPTMWLWHSTHQEVEFMLYLLPLGQACDYEGSDAKWLPRLGYLLSCSQLWSL